MEDKYNKINDLSLTKKNEPKKITWQILILCFVFGVLGGGFFDRLVMPLVENFFKGSDKVVIADKTENINVEENSAIIEVAKKVSPSVVTIVGKRNVIDFWGQTSQKESSGTGFILTSDGMILTNKHVVEESRAEYTVITNDGKDFEAEVLSLDPSYDLAILKIKAENLPIIDLGDSNNLEIGQRVVAIGNALGQFQNSVTAGIISGKGRPISVGSSFDSLESELYEDLLQTDAAINPGNSGGPLLNLAGQVIGVNTAVADGENIGFAIPINIAKPAIESTMKIGKIIRPIMGVRYITITKDLASLYDLPIDRGAWLYSGSSRSLSVSRTGPAYQAGLRDGDIIIKVGKDDIGQLKSLASVIQNYSPGDEVEVTYLRDGQEKKTKVKLSQISG